MITQTVSQTVLTHVPGLYNISLMWSDANFPQPSLEKLKVEALLHAISDMLEFCLQICSLHAYIYSCECRHMKCLTRNEETEEEKYRLGLQLSRQ